jgi:hypothetical protein
LRELARVNIAEAMIDVAEGRMPHLSFSNEVIRFDNQGSTYSSSSLARCHHEPA